MNSTKLLNFDEQLKALDEKINGLVKDVTTGIDGGNLTLTEIINNFGRSLDVVKNMFESVKKEIDSMVMKIVNNFSIRKIILFGSYAYGNPTADSDIDICVISADSGRKIDIIHEIRKTIRGVKYPVDILVYNTDEFASKADSVTSMERHISQQGIVLYEQKIKSIA